MGIFKRILWFVGGKPPEIIYENGEVSHKHTDKKWKDWQDRFKSPSYDWRKHVATEWDKVKKSDRK